MYKRQVQQGITSQTISRQQLSNVENKAISNLQYMVKYALTEQKRSSLLRFIKLINDGKFASKGLPREVNDFYTANSALLSEPPVFLDRLFGEILDRYAIAVDETPAIEISTNSENKSEQRSIINPKIVLTVSFS